MRIFRTIFAAANNAGGGSCFRAGIIATLPLLP